MLTVSYLNIVFFFGILAHWLAMLLDILAAFISVHQLLQEVVNVLDSLNMSPRPRRHCMRLHSAMSVRSGEIDPVQVRRGVHKPGLWKWFVPCQKEVVLTKTWENDELNSPTKQKAVLLRPRKYSSDPDESDEMKKMAGVTKVMNAPTSSLERVLRCDVSVFKCTSCSTCASCNTQAKVDGLSIDEQKVGMDG